MRSFLLFTTVVCVANCFDDDSVTKCGDFRENQGSLGIYGGKNIKIEQAPYTVLLTRPGKDPCAGTILNEKWILTSGDCTNNMAPSNLTILAGSDDGETGQKFTPDKIVPHPKYSYVSLDNDISLVRQKGAFKWSTKIQPVALPSKPPKPNTKVIASGYGKTESEELDETNGHLMAGDFFWQSQKFCKGAYTDVSSWTPRMACAYDKGKTTLCQGDWADPLVFNKTVYGIFIGCGWEGFCSNRAKPIILTSIYPYVTWISPIINASTRD